MTEKSKKFLKMAQVFMIRKPSTEGEFKCPDLNFEDLGFCNIDMSQVNLVVNEESIPKAQELMSQTISKFVVILN